MAIGPHQHQAAFVQRADLRIVSDTTDSGTRRAAKADSNTDKSGASAPNFTSVKPRP